jgi:flagellar basal body rod protein FlgG
VVQEDGIRVRPGAREQSNVTAVDELVQMIVSMRYHEAAQRALKAIDSALQENTSPGG